MNDNPQVIEKWQKQMMALWPAAKGSLAKVYKPCIRPACPACARGEKHPAWLLSYTAHGRRRVVYVPLALVPQIRKAIANGRRIEKLLYRSGLELVKAHRKRWKNNYLRYAKS